jgi:hypothetical protein
VGEARRRQDDDPGLISSGNTSADESGVSPLRNNPDSMLCTPADDALDLGEARRADYSEAGCPEASRPVHFEPGALVGIAKDVGQSNDVDQSLNVENAAHFVDLDGQRAPRKSADAPAIVTGNPTLALIGDDATVALTEMRYAETPIAPTLDQREVRTIARTTEPRSASGTAGQIATAALDATLVARSSRRAISERS